MKRLPQSKVDAIVATAFALPVGGWHTKESLRLLIDHASQSEGVPGQVTLALGTMRRAGVTFEEGVGTGGVARFRVAPPPPTALEVLADIVGPRCVATAAAPDGSSVQCDRMGCDGAHEVDYGGPGGKVGDLVHRWWRTPATLPAPVPDDHSGEWEPSPRDVRRRAPVYDCLDCGEGEECSCEDPRRAPRPVNALSAPFAIDGHGKEACEIEGLARADDNCSLCGDRRLEGCPECSTAEPLTGVTPGGTIIVHGAADGPKPPGPSSRCAHPDCNLTFVHHATAGHPFAPKPRGRPVGTARPPGGTGPAKRAKGTARAVVDVMPPQAPPPPTAPSPETSLVAALTKAFPELAAPEMIDGHDVKATARDSVTLDMAFSPVLHRRDSLDPVDVTALDNGRYRLDARWPQNGQPIEVDASSLAVMRARYLLLRGSFTRALHAMDESMRRVVVARFFRGVAPAPPPPPGSPLATMDPEGLSFARPEGTGIEEIDFVALLDVLSTPGAAPPATVPLRPLGPSLPPPPAPEPPADHVIEGEHGKACDRWKVNTPEHFDPSKLPIGFRLCRACWRWIFESGGGRMVGPELEYVGDRYV